MSSPESLHSLSCVACGAKYPADFVETASVRCNVRAFAEQRFDVWRCPECRSIHARQPVELSRYYAAYPFHALPDDVRVRLVYGNQLARLRRAGLRSSHTILDYGCGSGEFVRYLKARGYEQTFGFDAYNPAYDSVAQLDRQFDCVLAQDVLEHVESPSALLNQLASLTRPGGILCIGTPNADAIHLDRPEEFVHTL
ncbi:MAG TPA: class I SAM-dependent methyltransferase, partial [Polyangiaceae bacterium]